MAEPGTQKATICGVCGEWMSHGELPRHMQTAHPEIEKLMATATRRVALIAVPGGLGLILTLVFYGGLTISPSRLPIALFGTLMISVGMTPLLGLAMKQARKAYDDTRFRCWVCDTRVPHRHLATHLREFHQSEAKDYFLSEIALYAFFAGSLIAGLIQIVGLLDRSVSPLLSVGLTAGLVALASPNRAIETGVGSASRFSH